MFVSLSKFIYFCAYISAFVCVYVYIYHISGKLLQTSWLHVSPLVLSACVFYLGVPILWHIRNLPCCLLSRSSPFNCCQRLAACKDSLGNSLIMSVSSESEL